MKRYIGNYAEPMKNLILVIGVVIVLFMSFSAEAGRQGGGFPEGRFYDDIAATPELSLTAEQAGKLRAAREIYLLEIGALKDRWYEKSGKLKSLWLQQLPDRHKISDTEDELRTIREQLYAHRLAYWREATKILTPAQQAKVQAYAEESGYDFGDGRKNRRGMGMGTRMDRGVGKRGD